MRVAAITLTVCGAILLAGCGDGPGPQGPTAKMATSPSGVPLVLIPAGTFAMGSDKGKPDEGPVHQVTVSAFAMDQYEVTQDELRALEIPNPSHPYGIRGVGEASIVPPLGAIGNAIANATGVRMTHAPMSPVRVLDALDEAEAEVSAG